jgi:hypothetical protein
VALLKLDFTSYSQTFLEIVLQGSVLFVPNCLCCAVCAMLFAPCCLCRAVCAVLFVRCCLCDAVCARAVCACEGGGEKGTSKTPSG